MSIPTIINKVDSFQMAIESIQVLVEDHADEYLKPTLTYLKEQKQKTANELATFAHNIEVQAEEIKRLSHI